MPTNLLSSLVGICISWREKSALYCHVFQKTFLIKTNDFSQRIYESPEQLILPSTKKSFASSRTKAP